jgi:uncharacterized protein
MMDKPSALGVGMIYSPGLEPAFEAGADLVDVIEIEPQLRRGPDGRYRLREEIFGPSERVAKPKLIHGVGFPVGGTAGPDERDLAAFVEAIDRTGAPWASEHLSFNQVRAAGREFFGGFLLPPVQSPAAVRLAARNIRAVAGLLPVPFAFETGVNYLERLPGEMTDGAFFAAVAEEADCGILLDLHNLWCNERNGRQSVLDALAEMPLDRVWEVHLAGGSELDGLWLDAHSSTVPEPLCELAAQVLPCLPNLGAVIFEIAPEVVGRGLVPPSVVVEQLRCIRELWDAAKDGSPADAVDTAGLQSQRVARTRGSVTVSAAADSLPDPARWESVLGALTVTGSVSGSAGDGAAGDGSAAADSRDGDGADASELDLALARTLASDRAMPTLRKVAQSFRSGVVISSMPLAFRLIMFSAGEQGFHELMKRFWQDNLPRRYPAEEIDDFLAFLRTGEPGIAHLDEVAAYELATRRVRTQGGEERVRFTCEPVPLLTDLAGFKKPRPTVPGEFEVLVTP